MRRLKSSLPCWRSPTKSSRHSPITPIRPSRISGCSRRFAGRKSLTVPETLGGAHVASLHKLRSAQSLPGKSIGLFGDFDVDALVFEFMGLAIIGLCVIVLV